PHFSLALKFGKGELAVEDGFNQQYYNSELLANWRFAEDYKFSPYVFGGLGVLNHVDDFQNFSPEHTSYNGILGVGFEQSLNRSFDLNFAIYNSYAFSDELDGEVQGNYNDYFWGAKIGIRFYPRTRKKSPTRTSIPPPAINQSPVLPAPANSDETIPTEGQENPNNQEPVQETDKNQ